MGTFLMGAEAVSKAWLSKPDPDNAQKFYDQLNEKTLGRLLGQMRNIVEIDDEIHEVFKTGLASRNRLMYGFYEKHNFRIDSDDGRDKMIEHLEELHTDCFNAWQQASAMTRAMHKLIGQMIGKELQ